MAVHQRLTPLLAQFDFGVESLLDRVQGMTDDEYFWEPVAGCWNIRRRDDDRGVRMVGKGEWALEQEHIPFDAPDPPFTTIAWRLAHLSVWITVRADWTIGTKSIDVDDIEMPSSAATGIVALERAAAFWREALTTATTDADLDQVGRSSYPGGLDPTLPFIDIVWWVNKELIHHAAEIALLRDLWRVKERD